MATSTDSARLPAPSGRNDRAASRQRWVIVLREAAFIAAAALLYSVVRGMTDDRVEAAFANAEHVIAFERSLGIFIEADLQRAALEWSGTADIVNAIYISYWPLVFGTLAWLLIRHPETYPLYRNALLASGALSLAVFAAYPLAPPRFLPEYGFVDTIAKGSDGYRSFNASAMVNEYAAMPSLHFGWVLLLATAVVAVAHNRAVRAVAIAAPALMLVAIVLTGNHYIVDGVVGGVVVLGGLGIAYLIRRRFGAVGPLT